MGSQRLRTALAVVFFLALALRLWGIGFALPYDFTADEPHHIVQALKIGAGEGGPLLRAWHTVGKGGLDYLLFFEYGILFLFWRVTGRVGGAEEFALRYLEDPTAFYLLGRLTIALLGALTCLVVYWAGKRMFDDRVGLGASLLAATSYFHGAQSHIINVHIAMAFALWTGIACYLEYERRPRPLWALLCGFLIGAATALAYTAAIGLPLVLIALKTAKPRLPWFRGAGFVAVSFMAAIALMSPDLLSGIGKLASNFGKSAGRGVASEGTDTPELRDSIDAVTILRGHDWSAYLAVLGKPINLLLSLGALAGALVGVVERKRWALALALLSTIVLVMLSASGRSTAERYLLPIIPALWVLCSLAARELSKGKVLWNAAFVSAVAALPLWNLIGQDFIWTRPDTRVVAKQWIESHLASDSKILIDGMRFRLVQSPPLNPNAAALGRRLSSAESSELILSKKMLSLYARAQSRILGPKYDLYSTVYGIEVEELDYYVANCFDYVITSSLNASRYETEDSRRRFPERARFYDGVKSDPRFEVIYRIEPARWRQWGPVITVYRVLSTCRQQTP
jgi:4-amino-4-deoxy-L-arabinose transferase-like glycosyltransferase